MADLQALRLKARILLHLSDPVDALYAYYALYHDPRRTELFIHEDAEGHTDGFAAVCLQTPGWRRALGDEGDAHSRPRNWCKV